MSHHEIQLQCLKGLVDQVKRLEEEVVAARTARDSLAKLLGVDWTDPEIFDAAFAQDEEMPTNANLSAPDSRTTSNKRQLKEEEGNAESPKRVRIESTTPTAEKAPSASFDPETSEADVFSSPWAHIYDYRTSDALQGAFQTHALGCRSESCRRCAWFRWPAFRMQWAHVDTDVVRKTWVLAGGARNKANELLTAHNAPRTRPALEPRRPDKILVFGDCGYTRIGVWVTPKMAASQFMEAISRRLGFCVGDLRFLWDGNLMVGHDTFAELGVEHGDVVEFHLVQRGGKPVIYLFAPTETRASVELGLVPQWSISAVYPVVPVKETGHGQKLRWDVTTREDGSLTELNTGLDVAYLFWEAHTDTRPLSPPPSPTLPQDMSVESFNPLTADLTPADSVLLPTSSVTLYLDAALRVLGLHTEARTSFITYWLPSLLKHQHVALRFVPQAAYEGAAPLDVQPRPDVVTRVFMLFKGVRQGDAETWTEAAERARADVAWWRGVVGVDVEKAQDAGLFRVLEWGGMEVLRL